MASKSSEPQQGQRPAPQDDGRASQDEDYAIGHPEDRGETYGDPDILLDVPQLNVEEIDLEVEELKVRLSLQADLADLVRINIGLEAEVDEVKLGIKGVEAQAQLKARLDNVRAIFSEVLESLEHSPQFFRQALPSVPETGGGPQGTTVDTAAADGTDDVARPPENGVAEKREQAATEAARKKAGELGMDLSTMEGSGAGGRITLRDVQKAARN